MTRDEYKALWRAMTPAEKTAESLRMVGDLGGGIALIGAVAVAFKFLPVIVALMWALADAIKALAQ